MFSFFALEPPPPHTHAHITDTRSDTSLRDPGNLLGSQSNKVKGATPLANMAGPLPLGCEVGQHHPGQLQVCPPQTPD